MNASAGQSIESPPTPPVVVPFFIKHLVMGGAAKKWRLDESLLEREFIRKADALGRFTTYTHAGCSGESNMGQCCAFDRALYGAGIRTFSEMQYVMLQFVTGKHSYSYSMTHAAPLCEESLPHVEEFAQMNRLGFITTGSQPGICDQEPERWVGGEWGIWQQRPYIDGIMRRDHARALHLLLEKEHSGVFGMSISGRSHYSSSSCSELENDAAAEEDIIVTLPPWRSSERAAENISALDKNSVTLTRSKDAETLDALKNVTKWDVSSGVDISAPDFFMGNLKRLYDLFGNDAATTNDGGDAAAEKEKEDLVAVFVFVFGKEFGGAGLMKMVVAALRRIQTAIDEVDDEKNRLSGGHGTAVVTVKTVAATTSVLPPFSPSTLSFATTTTTIFKSGASAASKRKRRRKQQQKAARIVDGRCRKQQRIRRCKEPGDGGGEKEQKNVEDVEEPPLVLADLHARMLGIEGKLSSIRAEVISKIRCTWRQAVEAAASMGSSQSIVWMASSTMDRLAMCPKTDYNTADYYSIRRRDVQRAAEDKWCRDTAHSLGLPKGVQCKRSANAIKLYWNPPSPEMYREDYEIQLVEHVHAALGDILCTDVVGDVLRYLISAEAATVS